MARRLEYGIHWIFLLALRWRPVEVPVGNFSQSMRNGKAAPQAVCPTWISTVPHPAPEWMRYNLCLVRVSMFRWLQPLLYKWLIVSGNMNMQARSFCTLLAKSKKPFEWNNLSMFGILGRPSHIILLLKQIKADILSRAAWVWRDSWFFVTFGPCLSDSLSPSLMHGPWGSTCWRARCFYSLSSWFF